MNPKILGALAAIGLAVVLLWPSGSSQKVKQLYDSAVTLQKNKDYEGAIEKYNAALEAAKEWGVKTEVIDKDFNTLAKFKIAVCYAQMAEQTGDITYYDESLSIIEEVAQQATVPQHREGITFLWGHILYKTDQYELAEPKFRTLIENFPNSSNVEEAWYAIGQLNYRLQEYEEARKAFKQILANFPNSQWKDDAQQLIAESFRKEENYSQALTEYDRLSTEEFKNFPELQAEAAYKAAWCQKQLENDQEAIARYSQFVTDYPNSQYVTAAYFDMGAIYSKQKDYDNAQQNYQLALENTNDPSLKQEIWREIGRTYSEQEDYEKAITAYETLINEYPENPYMQEAKLGIADSYFGLEQWDKAIDAYQRVINEHPEDEMGVIPFCTYQIGESYYQSERYEQALSWYQKVLDDYPDDAVAPHALYGAVWSLSELERYDEVQKLGEDFIAKKREDPDFDAQAAEIQLKLGDIQFDIGNYIKATEEYAKVWNDYPDLPKFNFLKLTAKLQEGQSYLEAAKPEDYDETLDKDWNFNEEYLNKSVAAYQQAIDNFSAENFNLENDFPERKQYVENCIINQAVAYENLGQWSEARENYQMIAQDSEYYSKARLLIAQTYIEEGNAEKGIEVYQETLASEEVEEDDKSLAKIKLADLLREQERYTEAAQQYQQIVEDNPEGEFADDAQYLVGMSYYHIEGDQPDDLNQAIDAFQKVIENYPDSPNAVEAFYGITLARQKLGEAGDESQWGKIIETVDTAEAAYGESEKKEVQKTLSYLALMKARAIKNSPAEAENVDYLVAEMEKVANNESADIELRTSSLLNIGNILYEAERYQESIDAYQKLISMFPEAGNIGQAYYQIALCHFRIGQKTDDAAVKKEHMQKVVEATQKALQHQPDTDMQIGIYYIMGIAKDNLGENQEAISALQKVVSYEGETDQSQQKTLIAQSHTRLAELYKENNDYSSAVKEYQYIIQNSNDKETLERIYFALGYAYDQHLGKPEEAVEAYQKSAQYKTDPVMQAQTYYRLGLLYQNKLRDADQAIQEYNTLINQFATNPDNNIQAMVTDARIRKSNILVGQGKLEDAIADAQTARDNVMASETASLSQKIQAQYQLGYLKLQKAQSLFKEDVGQYDEAYKNATRDAAQTYAQIYEIAQNAGIQEVPESSRIYVRHGMYQAGEVWYSLQFQADLQKAVPMLEEFVQLVDSGYFGSPNETELQEVVKKSMNYIASSYFQLARYADLDPELFEKSAQAFKRLVNRFPNAPQAPEWQYTAGEAYFASTQYQKAIDEYQKVVEMAPQHEVAPDALYAISTCYSAIAEETDDPESTKEIVQQVYELNERLANEYPTSKYAPEAFINLGNKYYNQGSKPDISPEEKERLYRLAIEQYQKALDIESIEPQSKNQAIEYLLETKSALAIDIFYRGLDQMSAAEELQGDEKQEKINEAIETFRTLTEDFGDTPSGELAYVQLGKAYTMLASEYDESYYRDALQAYGHLWNKYANSTPDNNQVANAVEHSKQQIQRISAYIESRRIHEESSE